MAGAMTRDPDGLGWTRAAYTDPRTWMSEHRNLVFDYWRAQNRFFLAVNMADYAAARDALHALDDVLYLLTGAVENLRPLGAGMAFGHGTDSDVFVVSNGTPNDNPITRILDDA